MRAIHKFVQISIPLMLMAMTGIANGQTFPAKPIRILTSEAGGTGDFTTRLIGQGLTTNLGQPVIVENLPTFLLGRTLAKSPADGHTLLLGGNILWLAPLMRSDLEYDAVRDFSPISMVASSPLVVVVHPSLPAKTIKELIAIAKAKPGELNYSAGSPGTTLHLAAELFKSMAGVNIVGIPHKGTAQALTTVIRGDAQVMFTTPSSANAQVKAGKLRMLAVTSEQRSPSFPDLPTLSELGLIGYEAINIHSFFAPAKTPTAVINRLNQETVKILNIPDIREKLLASGVDIVGSSPAILGSKVNEELKLMGKVIREVGIKVD